MELATKWEKFAKTGAEEFRQNYDNAYSCVELLLSAGADIYPEILQQAGTTEVADLIHHYDMTINNEVYNFIKRSMGKCSLNVHNQLLSAVSILRPGVSNFLDMVVFSNHLFCVKFCLYFPANYHSIEDIIIMRSVPMMICTSVTSN